MSDQQPAQRKKGGPHLSTKPRCGALLSDKVRTCRRHPLKDQKRCKLHGGGSPQAKRKAEERAVEKELRKVLGDVEAPAVKDPLTAIAELAGEVLAWKDLLATRIATLQSYGYAGEHGEQVRHEVQLYEKALDRCITVLDKIARLDIDSRLAAIGERQTDLLERGLDAALSVLDLSPEQTQRAWGALATYLLDVPRVA